MAGELFRQVHSRGRAAVLAGEHQCEGRPQATGRWGHSIVSFIAGDVAASLGSLTREAVRHAGSGHWLSGCEGRAHVTIRALEPYSDEPPDVARLERQWGAFEQVFTTPLNLGLVGIVLAPAGVMVQCRDLDGAADALRSGFARALGLDGWFEDAVFTRGRDPIWYSTILHFAGPVRDPHALVEWVEERSEPDLGEVCLDTFSLCRWDLDEYGMAPTALRTRSFTSPSD